MSEWTPPEGHAGRWILACVAGLGLGAPLGVAWNAVLLPALGVGLGGAGPLGMVVHAVSGAIMGAVLGAAQAAALGRAYPALSAPAWIGATAAAGYVAALLSGAIYGALAQVLGSIPIPFFVLLGATVKGVLAGLLYGLAQGRVLDAATMERAGWLRVVLVGWLLGAMLGSLRWLVAGPPEGAAGLVAGAAIGGVVEGLAIGLVAAGAFRFMPPRPAP